MFSLRTRCLSTCVVAVLALCSVVQAQKTQTFAGKRRVEAPAAAPAGEAVTPRLSTQSPFRLGDPETVVCYGIVGAINAPDVYAPGTESFTLKQLIEMAAGTTADASAEIRIFRSGRPLSVSLNSAEKENLSHGDVVLIPTAMNAMREIGGPPVATVACLGLAQRPVIIPLAGHQPALATLVEVLQQDHLLRLVNPNDTTNPWQQVIQIYHPTGVKSDNPSLADGSVVIFDPQAIRADRLKLAPPLPLPKTETAKLKGKQTDFSTYVRQDRPRGSVAEPLIAPAPPRKFPQEFESLLLDNPEAPPTETVLPASGTQPLTPTTEAELATEPSTEDAQEDSETTPLVPADRGTQVKILGGVLLFLMTFGIGVILNQARHEVDRPANASLTPVVARPIAPQEPAPTATVSLVDAAKIFPADRPTKRDTALDALIENRIPLHLEPIVLPAALQLFGRPIGHRTLIIDRQHAVPQPHFEEKVARESVATRVAAATRETSETVLPDALERALGRVKRSQTVARAS